MDRLRYPRAALVALVTTAALTTGCAAEHPIVATGASNGPSSTTSTTSTLAAQASQAPRTTISAPGEHGRRGGSEDTSAAAPVELPRDWPSDLPVPPGTLSGSTGSAGRWTVRLLVPGPAANVRRSTLAFYTAAGFRPVSDSILNKGNRQLTIVVENRDHSSAQTNLLVAVTTT